MTVHITVTLLGTGTAVPWRLRSPPGLVIEASSGAGSALALVDPSAGSSQRLVQRGYDFQKLSHVLFSHYHPDHTGDLVPILFAMKNPRLRDMGRSAPVRFVGPEGLLDLTRSLQRVYGGWIEHEETVRFQEISAEHRQGFFTVGPLEVMCFPVEHSAGSVAYRFEARSGQVVAYSGDTDICDGVIDAARDADLLVLECAFPEGQKHPGHLVPTEAGKIAAAANARRVILTHLYPECRGHDMVDPARQYFRGSLSVGEDGMTIHL